MVSISLKGASVNDIEVPTDTVNTLQVFTVSLSVIENTYQAYVVRTYLQMESDTYAELSGYYSWSDYADRTWSGVSSYTW